MTDFDNNPPLTCTLYCCSQDSLCISSQLWFCVWRACASILLGKCRISLATMFNLRQYCHLELVPTTKMTPVSRRIRFYRVTEMIFGFTKVDFHHWGTWYILWNSARQNILASLHITIFISTQDKITIVSISIFLALVKCRQPRKISEISKFAWLFPVHNVFNPRPYLR